MQRRGLLQWRIGRQRWNHRCRYGSYNSANMTVNIQTSTFGDANAANGLFSNGVTIGPNDTSTMNATVNGSSFNNTNGLRVNSASDGAFTYAVTNNDPIFNRSGGSN